MVQDRLSERKQKELKDYDAEVRLLASLQADGVAMHNMEHVLKRRPIYEHAKAYKIQTKLNSDKDKARVNMILSDRFNWI